MVHHAACWFSHIPFNYLIMTERESPSLIAVAVAAGIFGLVAGYFFGQGSSIGLFGTSGSSDTKKSWPNSYDVKVHADSSDEADDEDDEPEDEGDGKELRNFDDTSEEVKLVLAVRTDLGMTKGKIAAQCGHATLACYKYLVNSTTSTGLLRKWENNGQPKIAVQAKSEEELDTLHALAVSLGLCARVIHDAGRTQIAAGSATVLGVLGPKSVVDRVTGHLKLL